MTATDVSKLDRSSSFTLTVTSCAYSQETKQGHVPIRTARPNRKSSARSHQNGCPVKIDHDRSPRRVSPRIDTGNPDVFLGEGLVRNEGNTCKVLAINSSNSDVEFGVDPVEIIPFEYVVQDFESDSPSEVEDRPVLNAEQRNSQIREALDLNPLNPEEKASVLALVQDYPELFLLPGILSHAPNLVYHEIHWKMRSLSTPSNIATPQYIKNPSGPQIRIAGNIVASREALTYRSDNYITFVSQDCEPSTRNLRQLSDMDAIDLQAIKARRPALGQAVVSSFKNNNIILLVVKKHHYDPLTAVNVRAAFKCLRDFMTRNKLYSARVARKGNEDTMATDERKVVGYTINEEIPVVTLLKVAHRARRNNGHENDIPTRNTTAKPWKYIISRTPTGHQHKNPYNTGSIHNSINPNTISPDKPINTTTPINQSTVPNSDQYENKQNEKTLVLVYNAKLAKESQILGLLQILAGPTGLADIQVHRPGHHLMVTLTYRSAEIKQQTLIYLRNEKKRAPREEKQASPRPPTKQHEAEVDINRLHILMPRGMSKEEAIDILAECGPIDHLDFVAMGPKKYNLQAIFIRYCTEEGAARAKRSDRFRGEIRHAKGQNIPAPFRNLPKWFHCIYCGHQATSFRRRDHDAICARQMAVEEESYWKGPELKANSIINFKTHYFCGRGIDRTAWADHIKVCNIRNFSREIPKQVTCREVQQIIEEIYRPPIGGEKQLHLKLQYVAKLTAEIEGFEKRVVEIEVSEDLNPIHDKDHELWDLLHAAGQATPMEQEEKTHTLGGRHRCRTRYYNFGLIINY
ncbi:unnamed protein product [Trichogramma brassicae]|uniref:Uncharacterized protein n=1 Tax=Trichogramma brassicae TaxID=86971 RepID=A0A6H5HYP2_9HYME|nr:unnamed protein product [Trichogramma brassicae]